MRKKERLNAPPTISPFLLSAYIDRCESRAITRNPEMRKNISDDEARISCQTYDKKEKEFASEIRKQAGSSSQNDRIRCIHRNLTPECSDILWKIPGTQIIWRRAVLSGKRFQEHRESFFRFDLYRSGDDRHSSRAEESCCWQGPSIFWAGVSNPAGRFCGKAKPEI